MYEMRAKFKESKRLNGDIGTSDKGRCWVKCRDFGYAFAVGLCYTGGARC